jgi:hypothetical protein
MSFSDQRYTKEDHMKKRSTVKFTKRASVTEKEIPNTETNYIYPKTSFLQTFSSVTSN